VIKVIGYKHTENFVKQNTLIQKQNYTEFFTRCNFFYNFTYNVNSFGGAEGNGKHLAYAKYFHGSTLRSHPFCLKTVYQTVFFTAKALIGFDSLPCSNKKYTTRLGGIFFGGAEGNRTPVRSIIHKNFSGCSRCLVSRYDRYNDKPVIR